MPIENAAGDGTLPSCPCLGYLLLRWRAFGAEHRVTEFVAQFTESDEGFADFLAGFPRPPYIPGSADPTNSAQWHIDVEPVPGPADTTGVYERGQRILARQPPRLNPRRKLGLEVFVREMRAAAGASGAPAFDA